MKRNILVLLVVLILSACSDEPGETGRDVDIEAGKALAESLCAGCHTLGGLGKTSEIPNLAAQSENYLIEAMHAYREGRRHHAALEEIFGGLTDPDIANLAAYFSGLPAASGEQAPSGGLSVFEEGAQVAESCVTCHGEDGFSTMPGVPNLAGQHPMYLIVATQEYARGERDNAKKEAMLQGLDNVDIEKMAMYFAAQAPEPRDPPPFGDPAAGEAQTALCGGCHGARGVSEDPLVPNLAGQEPNYLVKAIKAYRDRERSHEDMVADKTDEEIEDIAAFYSIQVPGSVTDAGALTTEVIAKCDRCHGAAAGESTMVVPVLHGQNAEYLLRVMQEYRDGQRGSTMMHKMSAGYSDRVLAEIAEYYATHTQPN